MTGVEGWKRSVGWQMGGQLLAERHGVSAADACGLRAGARTQTHRVLAQWASAPSRSEDL